MKQIICLMILTAVFVGPGCIMIEPAKNQPLPIHVTEKFSIEPDDGRSADILTLFSGCEELRAQIT